MTRFKPTFFKDSKIIPVSLNKSIIDDMQLIMKQRGDWSTMSGFMREAVLRLIDKYKKEMERI